MTTRFQRFINKLTDHLVSIRCDRSTNPGISALGLVGGGRRWLSMRGDIEEKSPCQFQGGQLLTLFHRGINACENLLYFNHGYHSGLGEKKAEEWHTLTFCEKVLRWLFSFFILTLQLNYTQIPSFKSVHLCVHNSCWTELEIKTCWVYEDSRDGDSGLRLRLETWLHTRTLRLETWIGLKVWDLWTIFIPWNYCFWSQFQLIKFTWYISRWTGSQVHVNILTRWHVPDDRSFITVILDLNWDKILNSDSRLDLGQNSWDQPWYFHSETWNMTKVWVQRLKTWLFGIYRADANSEF